LSTYCTQQDLVVRFGLAHLLLLADRDQDQVLDADVVAQAIASASAEIDLAVRGLYAVPLSPVDPVIVDIACDLALLRLYVAPTNLPEGVLEAAKVARALLTEIAAGRRDLTAARISVAAGPATNDVLTAADDPMFTLDGLKGF